MKGMDVKGKKVRAALILAAALQAGAATAWEDYPGFQGAGHAGIAIGDFDGSGKLVAAVTGNTDVYYSSFSSQLLAVLGTDVTGQLGVRTISMLPTRLVGPLVPAPREGQADRLAAVVGEGAASQILILGGVPLRVVRTIEAPFVRKVTAIVDVDADGRLDVVAMAGTSSWSDSYPAILDYETGAVQWLGSQTVTDIGVAQLDGDAALELILAGTPGRIVDGATHAVEWTYPSGFVGRILVGRFNADPNVPGFAVAVAYASSVQVFRGQPYSPVSEFATNGNGFAGVVRLSPGGADQIATSGYGVAIYDPRNGQRLLSVGYPDNDVAALAVGDIDGDARAEVVYGSRNGLRAIDLTTQADDYSQNRETGPHTAIAPGDLAGNGSEQLAYLTPSSSSGSGSGSSVLRVLDAASGKRLRTRSDVFSSWTYEPPHIAVAQLDGDAQQEIILAGSGSWAGEVAVLDGLSLQDQWRVGGYNSVFGNGTISSLAAIDVNGDGIPDVVVATSGGKVVVLDGRNGAVLWQSVTLNGNTPPSLAALRLAAGGPGVAVARGAGLYVFDLASHLLVATTKTAAGVVGLWQWGEGAACRLAALDQAAVVTLHRCDTLALEGQRLLPTGSAFFRPLDASATRLIAASGPYLYEVAADGTAIPISTALGNQLGIGNKGLVRAGPDPQHVDVIIGSDYMIARKVLGFDALFANGFD
ncbi:MAG: hypothetical protein GXC76_12880 [Rhodanobacteraceae bacterium]|jgi:hypothetical protein|nr:hypothetical protein [Rhodanobacteraceae bacterium]